MTNKYFTSDWHLFHNHIIEYCDRKPASVQQMHQTLVFNHNQIVKPDDELWVIGDISLMSAEFAGRVGKQIEKFNGIKHLVLGNHDEWKAQSFEKIGFTTVHTAMWFKFNDLTFYMMHDPSKYIVIEKDPKAILLCGHVHTLFQHLLPKKRVINVGVDAWDLKPVSFNQILQLLSDHNVLELS